MTEGIRKAWRWMCEFPLNGVKLLDIINSRIWLLVGRGAFKRQCINLNYVVVYLVLASTAAPRCVRVLLQTCYWDVSRMAGSY